MPSRDEETIRLGVVHGEEIRSLSFNLTRRGEEVYISSRDFPQIEKLSLHSSRKHRLASKTSEPRAPKRSSELLRFNEGQFWTVARILMTTREGWSSGAAFGHIKKGMLPLPACDRREAISVAIGLTSHHPSEHVETSDVDHATVMKVDEGKYLTVTSQVIPQHIFKNMIYNYMAMKRDAKAEFFARPRQDGVVDQLVTTFTNLNTYLFWTHHGLQDEGSDWFAYHPLGREMLRGQADLRAGRYTGIDSDAALRRLAPDWVWQVRAIKSGYGRGLNSGR